MWMLKSSRMRRLIEEVKTGSPVLRFEEVGRPYLFERVCVLGGGEREVVLESKEDTVRSNTVW